MVEVDSGVSLNKVGGWLGLPSPRFTVLAGRRLARERELIRSQSSSHGSIALQKLKEKSAKF